MSTVLRNLFLLDMSIFNELVIKNDPVKKATSFFVYKEGGFCQFHKNFRVSRSLVNYVHRYGQFKLYL